MHPASHMMRVISIGLFGAMFLALFAAMPASAAPTTSLGISGAQYGTTPLYVTAETSFTLTAVDPLGSPVTQIWYQWDTYNYTKYVTPFNPIVEIASTSNAPPLPMDLPDGLHTLRYNSTDSLGQNEAVNTKSVYVDNTLPTTNIVYEGTHAFAAGTDYITGATEIKFTSADAGSGVSATYYSLDGGANVAYSVPFTVPAGAHTLKYYSVDNVQWAETARTLNLVVDSDAPTVTIGVGEPSVTIGEVHYVPSSSVFTLIVEDISLTSETVYMIDSGAWTAYTGAFSVPTAGEHTIKGRATDVLSQMSEEAIITVYIDSTAPLASVNGSAGALIEIESGDSLELVATDVGVGQCTIYYSLNGEPFQQYTGPIEIEEETLLKFYAKDGVGNMGAEVSVQVNMAPSGFATAGLIVGLIAGAAIFAVVYIIYRRKPKSPDSTPERKKDSGEDSQRKKKIKRNY